MRWGFGATDQVGRVRPALAGRSPFTRPPYGRFVEAMIGLGRRHVEGGDQDSRMVCARCCGDPDLKRLVRHLGRRGRCSFCDDRRASRVAPVTQVAAFIGGCFDHWFDDPEAILPIDDEVGGLAGDPSDPGDMVHYWVDITEDDGRLAEALTYHLGEGW
jgi:hypothetical protein